ncbi:hypothetical protein C6P46_002280 [Rhodotorula mucilaginosa]|uniref:Uncharacterized protein n=1 Tax=Rhodotorula mucilaginosa TaxID=5537 RepID=A0A9P6W4Q9_RHOMI|nr:hypothetical protein C6P46_002280 [Rhodotorula mucilaginosa]
MTESKLRLRLSLPLEPHHLSVTTLSWPGMPTLLLAWALLLALARAAPLFQAEQAVLTASLHSIDTASTTTPRPDRTAYFDPRAGGGAQYNRNLWDGHEPLNIIISAQSSADVLKESGFIAYSRSLGAASARKRSHAVSPAHHARVSWVELSPLTPTLAHPATRILFINCKGGNHFRAYKQNGTDANSGAWFLAASKEVDLRGKHKIAHNGYNIGRDLIVEKATSGSSYLNRRYEARVDWVEGLLPPGNEARADVNDHVRRPTGMAHGISQDGRSSAK